MLGVSMALSRGGYDPGDKPVEKGDDFRKGIGAKLETWV